MGDVHRTGGNAGQNREVEIRIPAREVSQQTNLISTSRAASAHDECDLAQVGRERGRRFAGDVRGGGRLVGRAHGAENLPVQRALRKTIAPTDAIVGREAVRHRGAADPNSAFPVTPKPLMIRSRVSLCVAKLVSPTLAICVVATHARAQQASASAPSATTAAWTDPSHHRARMVTVAPKVSLEILDWGD